MPVGGDVLQTDEFTLTMIHTPGHASNHVCYLQDELKWLYTGDHIMNGSTVVIDPPDGNMAQYISSLEALKQYPIDAIAPGHGDLLFEPIAVIDWIVAHRLEREEKVVAALRGHPNATSTELVPHAYAEVDKKLYGWAERSLLAHLGKLQEEGRARVDADRWTLISQ